METHHCADAGPVSHHVPVCTGPAPETVPFRFVTNAMNLVEGLA